MKAVVCRDWGPPEGLRIENLPSPTPERGEVLVRLHAAAVNFPDTLIIQQKYQHKPALPFSPGYELSGTVSALGEGVSGLAIGDRVIGLIRWGAYAEEVRVPAERAWKVPDGVDLTVAAAFPLAYHTSFHALNDRAALRRGETLLVTGASGGVGIAGVQLGKLMGARVIACASSQEKLALCREHGADELIDYTKEDLREAVKRVTGGRGLDVVLDIVGGRYAEPLIRSMGWGGRYCIVGFTDGAIPKIPLNLALLKGCSLVGVIADTYTYRDIEGGRRNYAALFELIRSGRLKPVVSRVEKLADAPRVLRAVMERKIVGKVVLVP